MCCNCHSTTCNLWADGVLTASAILLQVQLVTVAQLWQSALANGAFAQQAQRLGLDASAVFLNATVDTTDVSCTRHLALKSTWIGLTLCMLDTVHA